MNKEIPIWHKLSLTIEEASELSGIGINKLKEITKDPTCNFIFWIGKGKKLIKRKQFEEYIDRIIEI